MESAVTHIQPPELELTVGQSQPQLLSSRQNPSRLQDGISCNSHPAAGTQVSRGRESAATLIQPQEPESAVTCIQPPELETAATHIQPPELELAAGQNQPQLVFSRVSKIDILVGILDFNKYKYVCFFAFENFLLETVNFS